MTVQWRRNPVPVLASVLVVAALAAGCTSSSKSGTASGAASTGGTAASGSSASGTSAAGSSGSTKAAGTSSAKSTAKTSGGSTKSSAATTSTPHATISPEGSRPSKVVAKVHCPAASLISQQLGVAYSSPHQSSASGHGVNCTYGAAHGPSVMVLLRPHATLAQLASVRAGFHTKTTTITSVGKGGFTSHSGALTVLDTVGNSVFLQLQGKAPSEARFEQLARMILVAEGH